MPPDLDTPIPKEALSDLIAVCRALYLAYRAAGPGHDEQLTKLVQIGAKLSRDVEPAHGLYLPAKALITASGERLLRKR